MKGLLCLCPRQKKKERANCRNREPIEPDSAVVIQYEAFLLAWICSFKQTLGLKVDDVG